MTRIVPVLSQGSSHIFTAPSLVDPWVDRELNVLTGAIQPGIKFDMLGAATTQEMYDTGVADSTDSICEVDARINRLFYQTKNGKVHRLNVAQRKSFLFHPSDYHPGRLTLDAKVMLDTYGVPKTLFGKAMRKLRNFVGHRKFVTVHVMGYIDTEMAAVEVQCIEPSNSEIKIVGYTLDLQRFNRNRRPRVANV